MGEINPSLVHLFGHRESLSLDGRYRFRLPDDLARRLHREMGRIAGRSDLPPAAFERLSFYFVPGTHGRLFLYPPQNIGVAIARFDNPPPGQDPDLVRAARDYFYSMMCFVEADRQNRLQIPSHLQEHGGMAEGEARVVLTAHDLWLTLAMASVAEERDAQGRRALEEVGPSVLDPVYTQQQSARENGQQ